MTAAEPAQDLRAIEALLAFWAEAGVDACLGDVAVDRLAAPPSAPAAAARETAPPPAVSQPAAATPGSRVAEAQARAAAAGDLDALVAEARAFFPGGRPAVVLEAVGSARLLVLGDAPSAEDEAEGVPFRGPRGALLRGLLAAAGLADDALYINTVFRRAKGGADPSAADQAEAAPFVARAVALARPQAALLLGGCAVKGATGTSEPILKLRGRWLAWAPQGVETPLDSLPTLGLDFLIKHPSGKKQAWGDVLSLAARLAGPSSDG